VVGQNIGFVCGKGAACPQCYHTKDGVSSLDSEVECHECGTEYIPEEGYPGGCKYTCPACGQKESALKAVQRREGPPEAEMFALSTTARYAAGATRD